MKCIDCFEYFIKEMLAFECDAIRHLFFSVLSSWGNFQVHFGLLRRDFYVDKKRMNLKISETATVF